MNVKQDGCLTAKTLQVIHKHLTKPVTTDKPPS